MTVTYKNLDEGISQNAEELVDKYNIIYYSIHVIQWCNGECSGLVTFRHEFKSSRILIILLEGYFLIIIIYLFFYLQCV